MITMNFKIKNFLLLCFVLFVVSCSTGNSDSVADKRLQTLLTGKDFFKFRTELNKAQDKLSEDRLLYYKAHNDHLFNNSQASNDHIKKLLDNYKNKFNDTVIAEILTIKANNDIRLYDYKNAADVCRQIVEQYSNVLDSTEIENLENSYQLWKPLSSVKPQRIHKSGDAEIAAYYNRLHHLMVPVKCGGTEHDFIFDTGANLSTIGESFAAQMGLTIYESEIEVGTATHVKIKTKLAVADTFYIGSLMFKNVIFLVAFDEYLSIPEIDYHIKGIIGLPVIYQMEEIHMFKDGKIFTPEKIQRKDLHNMCLEGLNPIVQMISGNDTLLLAMDTGAVSSDLSKQYFEKHKEELGKSAKLIDARRGGAGGVIDVKEYRIENFPFVIGTKSGVLSQMRVSTEEFSFNKNFDGNLGQDVFKSFDEMILNFKDLYIDFN